MTQIIDRRLNSKNKSTVNRQRFIHRFKQQIKKAVSDAINKRSITDIENGEKVYIPVKDLNEPTFRHGEGGQREMVHPGNQEYMTGDHVKRQSSGSGQGGSKASNSAETDIDEFGFTLSREEFLELFFDDLALPNLTKKQLLQIQKFHPVRAGFTKTGAPNDLNVVRTMRSAMGRRIALSGGYKKKIADANAELKELEKTLASDHPDIIALRKNIQTWQKRMVKIPFIDTFDLRFNARVQEPSPSTQAVMFCIMDVSGSMDESKKDLAKRFFILLYLFLTRNYEKIELVFIRHHTSAKEVNEEEFFYSRETGGTVVSSALEMVNDIMTNRYPVSHWNIYIAQASDGDNWNADSPHCAELLLNNIMPKAQYYAYVEIMPQVHQNLWESYQSVQQACPNFAMRTVERVDEIYPVFRDLFKKTTIQEST